MRKRNLLTGLFALVAVAVVAAAAIPYLTAEAQKQTLAVGADAPDFKLERLSGGEVSLDDLKKAGGGYLVFFTTWCPHCVKEVPHINQVTAEATKNGKPMAVYGVNVRQPKRTVERFVKAREAAYPVLLDSDAAMAMAYKLVGVPTIVGIDAKGKVTYVEHIFPKNLEAARKALK